MAPILTNTESAMATLIESMTTEGGYNYDWGTCNQPDKALQDANVVAEIRLTSEENVDDDGGCDSRSYLNRAFYEIRVQTTMSSLTATPIHNVNAYHYKVLDDLKKIFGINYNVSAKVNSIIYLGTTTDIKKNGDLFTPGEIVTRWRVDYAQDRESPETNANT